MNAKKITCLVFFFIAASGIGVYLKHNPDLIGHVTRTTSSKRSCNRRCITASSWTRRGSSASSCRSDSDPAKVVEANERFSRERPDVPMHLGVTEAGLLPMGEIKTRIAFEKLLARGIGDTLRVSLTLPNDRKHEEVLVALRILADVEAGRFRSVPELSGLNIISCPSCSRVENEAFVELAEKVRELIRYAADQDVTIAVMGCRVNGPGETDDADLGLWCGPRAVNLKRGGERLGAFGYDEVLVRLKDELDRIIASRASRTGAGT